MGGPAQYDNRRGQVQLLSSAFENMEWQVTLLTQLVENGPPIDFGQTYDGDSSQACLSERTNPAQDEPPVVPLSFRLDLDLGRGGQWIGIGRQSYGKARKVREVGTKEISAVLDDKERQAYDGPGLR